MRGLSADVLDSGAWQLAWIAPSLPYHELRGSYTNEDLQTFTKRLVFSSWAVAPKAIGTVLSYEAERRITEQASLTSTSAALTRYDGLRPAGLLTFNRTDDRLSGMPVLGTLYPCVTLAEAGDPLDVARELGQTLPLLRADLDDAVRLRIQALLATLPIGSPDRAVDERWYWAAGILLDRARDLDAIADLPYGLGQAGDEDPSRFREHLAEARSIEVEQLGRRPEDLEAVLQMVALGGPGVVAQRALSRLGSTADLQDRDLRAAASTIAWGLRNHFNKPEIMGVVRGAANGGAYWQDVLAYDVDGCLQSVMDEYVYLLDQAVGAKTATGTWLGVAERFARRSPYVQLPTHSTTSRCATERSRSTATAAGRTSRSASAEASLRTTRA